MQTLRHFLKDKIPNDKKIYTHTRIGDKNLHVPGGVYNIPVEEAALFYKIYHSPQHHCLSLILGHYEF